MGRLFAFITAARGKWIICLLCKLIPPTPHPHHTSTTHSQATNNNKPNQQAKKMTKGGSGSSGSGKDPRVAHWAQGSRGKYVSLCVLGLERLAPRPPLLFPPACLERGGAGGAEASLPAQGLNQAVCGCGPISKGATAPLEAGPQTCMYIQPHTTHTCTGGGVQAWKGKKLKVRTSHSPPLLCLPPCLAAVLCALHRSQPNTHMHRRGGCTRRPPSGAPPHSTRRTR